MAKAKKQLTWVGTTGGPHLVVPEKHAVHWEGVAEPSHGRVVQATHRWDADSPATDYDRACDVQGYLGVVRIGRGRGVVLADYPTTVAYYPWDGRHFIVRWVCAPSEAALLAFVRSVVGNLAVEHEVAFRHPGGRLVLCDSSDTPRNLLGDHAAFDLPAGLYRVMASRAEAGESSVIVHEWRPNCRRPVRSRGAAADA